MSDVYVAEAPDKLTDPQKGSISIKPYVAPTQGPGDDDIGEPIKRPETKTSVAKTGAAASETQPAGADDIGEPIKPINYSKGVDFATRVDLERADNPEEAKLLLEKRFGAGNVGQDDKGEWWVKDPATEERRAVFPDKEKGLLQQMVEAQPALVGSVPMAESTPLEALAAISNAINSFAPRLKESITATSGPMAGVGLGTAAGALFGPGGAMIGAGLGYTFGKALDEIIKAYQGFYSKDIYQEAAALFGPEAAINMLQPGVGTKVAGKFKTKILGVTPQSAQMGREVMEEGARPPVGSVATEASGLEMKRKLSKEISGDFYREQNTRWLEARIKKFLTDNGLPSHEAKQLIDEMWHGSTAAEGKWSAQSIVDAAMRQHTSLEMATTAHLYEANQMINIVESKMQQWAKSAPRDLGVDIAQTLLQARVRFGKAMAATAKDIHNMIGGPAVPADDAISTAKKLITISPPDTVPAFVNDLAKMKPGSLLTIEQAHNYRTFAREAERNMLRGGNLTPGSDYHYFSEMEAAINDGITAVAAQSKGDVGSALKSFDKQYHEGIITFKNAKARQLMNRVQRGQVPEPYEVARDILEAGSMQDVLAIKKYLSPEQTEAVSKAFTDSLFRASSTEASEQSPQLLINPNVLLRNIEKYQDVMRTFGISPKFIGELKEFANTMRARNEKLDPNFLRQGPIRQKLAEWREAQRVLDEFVENTPLAAFRSGNAAAKDAALQFITNPAKKAAIKEVVAQLSPVERQDVQLYTLMRMFSDTMGTTSERLKTVSGATIKNWLKRYTEEQQDALFGYGVAKDLARLGDQVNYVFRTDELATGGSMAAVSVTSKGFFHPLALHKRMQWLLTTLIVHQPKVLTWLADLSEHDPTMFRMMAGTMNRWLITAAMAGPGTSKPTIAPQGSIQ
ncbi:MAG: hypothetical protein KGL39_17205 [Patescibacteria group bacterium]|nr:hypothetical protein [Patescibacteria group bacterium]